MEKSCCKCGHRSYCMMGTDCSNEGYTFFIAEMDVVDKIVEKQEKRNYKTRKEPTMVTQEEIDKVWQNADFGDMERVDVIKYGLLKAAGGWYQGHTSTCILVELGLIKRTKQGNKLTLRGQRNLYNYFKNKDKEI